MAEVQRRLEIITIEIEELAQIGILSDEECRCIIKKTFEYENKINSLNKTLQDFTQYISYAMCFHRMIQIRRNKYRISDKKHNLDYHIMQRVKNLYELAVNRFPQEIDLFFGFFQFCKDTNFQHASETLCQTMLKYHRNNDQVWLTVARLTFHEKDNPELAIKMLLQGIGIHKTSANLYTECIKYEVISLSKRMTEENLDLKALLCKKLETYLKEAKKHINSYAFYTDLLTFLKQYAFTEKVQIGLVEHLMHVHKNNAGVWNYLAHDELKGTHYNLEEGVVAEVSVHKSFYNCVAMFEKGLRTIARDYLSTLWSLYLNCIVALRNRPFIDSITDYYQIVMSAFRTAANDDYLSEKFYFLWLDMVDDGEKQETLKYATEKNPSSVDLWTLRLSVTTACNDREQVLETFQNAIGLLKDNSIPVWETMLEYNIDKCTKGEIKDFYQLALQQEYKNIGMHFRPRYIHWLANTEKTLKPCRTVYKELVNDLPHCKEMYDVMLMLEEKYLFSKASDAEFLQFMHKTACQQFGAQSFDVWINHIKYIYDAKNIAKSKERILQLIQEVRATLRQDMMQDFESAYDEVLEMNTRKKIRLSTDED